MRTPILILSLLAALLSPVSFASAQSDLTLTLTEAVKQALVHNKLITADQFDKEAAKWGTAQAVTGYLPRVYFTSSWTRLDPEVVNEAEKSLELSRSYGLDVEQTVWDDMYSSRLTVAQPIFNGGREIAAIWAAQAQNKERDFNLQNHKLTVIRDVTTAYYTVLSARQALEVAQESVALADESLAVATSRYQLGQINRSEVLRWEANKSQSQVAMIEAENALENALLAFANLLGTPLENRYDLALWTNEQIDQDILALPIADLETFPKGNSLNTHPSLMQSEQGVQLAKVDRFNSIGQILPSANFSYSYSWEEDNTIEPNGDTTWSAGIVVEIPLFQSLSGAFGIAKSQKSLRKAQINYEDFKRTLLQQLQMSQLNVLSAKNRVVAARKGQQFAKENLDLVSERHKLGMTSNLERIDAQFAYTQARSDYINAVGDFYKALAQYHFLTASAKQ